MPAEEAVETSNPHIVIIAGGDLATDPATPPDGLVIAADSGYDHALRLGLAVDVLVGDMDSISPEGLAHAMDSGAEIVRHDADKDHTDLDLAMAAAIGRGARHIDVHGAEDGRMGHLIGVVLGLTSEAWAGVDVRWHVASGEVRVLRSGMDMTVGAHAGDLVSIVPVGDIDGISATGTRWPLDRDAMPAGSTRGLSNEIVDPPARLSLDRGVALVITEGATS